MVTKYPLVASEMQKNDRVHKLKKNLTVMFKPHALLQTMNKTS